MDLFFKAAISSTCEYLSLFTLLNILQYELQIIRLLVFLTLVTVLQSLVDMFVYLRLHTRYCSSSFA